MLYHFFFKQYKIAGRVLRGTRQAGCAARHSYGGVRLIGGPNTAAATAYFDVM